MPNKGHVPSRISTGHDGVNDNPQRLRPPRCVSQRLNATAASTTTTSTMWLSVSSHQFIGMRRRVTAVRLVSVKDIRVCTASRRAALIQVKHSVKPSLLRDYRGVGDRTWITSRSGSGDVAISPMNGCESSKTRNRLAATSTPRVATIG